MEVRKRVTEQLTWKQVGEALEIGKAKELLKVGDQITVQHKDLGAVVFDVLDFDKEELIGDQKHSITLQMHKLLLPEMPFDEAGRNKWEKSTIREKFAKQEFINGFEAGFRELLAAALKKNDDREKTADIFFLLSVEEMTEIDERYAFYDDRANMCKQNEDGYGDWYWTRSANRGYGSFTWYVNPSGTVYSGGNAYYAGRCAPACVIAK